jgi:hypothetical protein
MSLNGIFAQGWTKIKIKVTNAREVNGVILVANEYTAFGSGANEGKTLDAKSSHVLSLVDGGYVSVLHRNVEGWIGRRGIRFKTGTDPRSCLLPSFTHGLLIRGTPITNFAVSQAPSFEG